MIEIIPAILTDSPIKFKELMLRVEPYTKRVHIDIADGEFVPNKTITGYEELMMIEAAVKFDVHLMVKRPHDIIKDWLHSYADRFIIHVESEGNLMEIIETLKKGKRSVGLALNPETDMGKVDSFLGKVDFVQFMTVHPGFQGGEFVAKILDKVRDFHAKYPEMPIAVDGSMHVETAKLAVSAGASIIVVGGHILFENKSVEASIKELQEACMI